MFKRYLSLQMYFLTIYTQYPNSHSLGFFFFAFSCLTTGNSIPEPSVKIENDWTIQMCVIDGSDGIQHTFIFEIFLL